MCLQFQHNISKIKVEPKIENPSQKVNLKYVEKELHNQSDKWKCTTYHTLRKLAKLVIWHKDGIPKARITESCTMQQFQGQGGRISHSKLNFNPLKVVCQFPWLEGRLSGYTCKDLQTRIPGKKDKQIPLSLTGVLETYFSDICLTI